MFKVGMKVVCITELPTSDIYGVTHGFELPKVGSIYIIKELDLYKGILFLAFEGLYAFHDEIHFRPLDYAFVEEVIKQVQPEKQPA